MATQTILRRGVMESRPHDHAFDPVYTSSLQRSQAIQYNRFRSGIPAWNNFFSSETLPAPQSLSSTTQALAATTQMAAEQTLIMGHPPPPQLPAVETAAGTFDATTADILGPSRIKYMKRPLVPFLQAVSPHQLESSSATAASSSSSSSSMQQPVTSNTASSGESKEVSLTRTIGQQTDYRESEAQTDPYTPDYITSTDQPEPEILGLSHLTYGQGLPASLEEVKYIHRLRDKRAFEASLPPLSDLSSFELRKKLLEERELYEWKQREEDMKKEQEERLNIMIQTLQQREAASDAFNEARIDRIRDQKAKQRDDIFADIHAARIKAHRALKKQRAAADYATSHMLGASTNVNSTTSSIASNGHRRDIVVDYVDSGSRVYAPIAREGRLPVKNAVVDYGIPLLNSFQGLTSLERSLPKHLTDLSISTTSSSSSSTTLSRKQQQVASDLAYVDSLLSREGVASKPNMIENVYKKFEPVIRAPTPSVIQPHTDDADRAVLLLQRLLRGRKVQNEMYEGTHHHRHLIAELRIDQDTHHPTSQKHIDEEQEEKQEMEREREKEEVRVACDILQGEIISSTLDFVSKELLRVQEEQHVAALVQRAKFIRRHREAQEGGKRQAEDILRTKREHVYESVIQQHAQTSHRLVRGWMTDAIKAFAHQKALHTSTVKAEALDPMITEIEDGANSAQTIVGDLVASFLLPEVDRRRKANETNMEERRFIHAAHQAVYHAIDAATICQ